MGAAKAKVYGPAVSPYVAMVLVCLEEAGAAYDLLPLDMAARENRDPPHLARNPFGRIPAFEDGELTIFESRAISRYVLRKHGMADRLLMEGSVEAAAVDVWMEVEARQYDPAVSAIVRQCIIEPLIGGARDQAVVDECAAKLAAVLDVYEARLAASEYLAGDSVTLADLAHFPFTHYLMATEHAPLVESRANVRAWWERLRARPSARKVAALMPTDFGMTPAPPA